MKLKVMSGVLASVLLATGCQATDNNNNEEGLRTNDTRNTENVRNNDNVDRNRNITQNVRNDQRQNDTEYNISKEAAERIVAEVDEIEGAYVITMNRNAYVATTLDEDNRTDTNTSRDGNGTSKDSENVTDREDIGVNDRTDVNNNLANRGNDRMDVNNNRANDNNDRTNANTDNVTNRNEGINDRTPHNRMDTSGNQNADANRNSDTSRRGANYGQTNDRMFQDDVSEEVKDQITKIVKDVDNNIDNVYVSTSPDFMDLATNYSDELENGRPVRGLFDQIGNMIDRVFPDNVDNNFNRNDRMNNPNGDREFNAR